MRTARDFIVSPLIGNGLVPGPHRNDPACLTGWGGVRAYGSRRSRYHPVKSVGDFSRRGEQPLALLESLRSGTEGHDDGRNPVMRAWHGEAAPPARRTNGSNAGGRIESSITGLTK